MTHAPTLDPWRLPLRGRQVIEASAGTGKTWTLAALYLRLVLGLRQSDLAAAASPDLSQALLPPQILVMTFTEAATAELRERIRARLSLAAQCFDAATGARALPEGVREDAFTRELRGHIDPALWPRCALQLHAAADWMDEAAIFTLHGWSRRMLAQHALQSGHLLGQQLLEEGARLQRSLTRDHWRRWFYPLSAAQLQRLLPALGASPDALLDALQPIWAQWEREPGPARVPPPTPAQVLAAIDTWEQRCTALRAAVHASWNEAVHQDLQAAHFHGVSDKLKDGWVTQLAQWCSQPDALVYGDTLPDKLRHFSLDALSQRRYEGRDAHRVFAHLDAFLAAWDEAPDVSQSLLAHAAHEVHAAYQRAKAQAASFDFSDLLIQLHQALHSDDGTLAEAIRHQYPVALVDEFQDTDPWQYGSLDRIYATDCVDARHALILIGDPKQAIYGFRGADLRTYLHARDVALQHDPDALHTLTTNHRSSAALVRAVSHVFCGHPSPFHLTPPTTGRIDAVPVQAADPAPTWAGPAMTVWHLPLREDKPWTLGAYLHHMAEVFASHMVELLQTGRAQAGDMAVLVRKQVEADAIRDALRQRGVASVYLSDRSSVFASGEAIDLWRVLCAMADPRALDAVRSALLTPVWGLSADEVLQLTQDEARWDALLTRCHHAHQRWMRQGVLPMLHHWLHEEGIAVRLLAHADGERRLSNLLHLGELLQSAAPGLQGPQSLTRWLAEHMATPPKDAQAQMTRLETDADCVQVVTYHKSKGLQYPLVFLPFVGSFAYAKSASDDDEATGSVEEDVRLLYVALTRAERALWLGVAETRDDLTAKGDRFSALSHLLQRRERGDLPARLHAQWGDCDAIHIAPAPEANDTAWHPPDVPAAWQAARTPARRFAQRWWSASFSAITRGLSADPVGDDDALLDALTDAAPLPSALDANDAHTAVQDDPDLVWQSFPAGARHGTLLHDLLQWQAEHGWPLAQGTPAPTWVQREWQRVVQQQVQYVALPEAAQQQLVPWLQRILTRALPLAGAASPLVLGQLPPHALWAEMAFGLTVSHARVEALDTLVRTHLFPGQPRPALLPCTLQGMLTGFMDLVVEHAGRYWVLDYKSNRLDGYDSARLTEAVLAKRYEVQYTLYALALYRLLRARLPGEDVAARLGGAGCLFLRGIDTPGAGWHGQAVPLALLQALDALLTQEVPCD